MKIGNKEFAIGIAIIIVGFFIVLFGFSGFRIIVGAFLLFYLPYYFMLDKLPLDIWEKGIFALFIGIMSSATLIYILGLLLSSMVIAMYLTFFVVSLLALIVRRKSHQKA